MAAGDNRKPWNLAQRLLVLGPARVHVLHRAQRLPNRAVALEARAEAHLRAEAGELVQRFGGPLCRMCCTARAAQRAQGSIICKQSN